MQAYEDPSTFQRTFNQVLYRWIRLSANKNINAQRRSILIREKLRFLIFIELGSSLRSEVYLRDKFKFSDSSIILFKSPDERELSTDSSLE